MVREPSSPPTWQLPASRPSGFGAPPDDTTQLSGGTGQWPQTEYLPGVPGDSDYYRMRVRQALTAFAVVATLLLVVGVILIIAFGSH
jgi:hypothetical protein